MVTIFDTRILRELSSGRTNILDAGCGDGRQAPYLARRTGGSVHGYDISDERITVAECFKKKHNIPNATFSVANHDDFQPPYKMDLIYTAGSLIGDDEIPYENSNPLMESEEIVRRRLSKFREIMLPNGLYIIEWGANQETNGQFVGIAESCGLIHLSAREWYPGGYLSDMILLFRR